MLGSLLGASARRMDEGRRAGRRHSRPRLLASRGSMRCLATGARPLRAWRRGSCSSTRHLHEAQVGRACADLSAQVARAATALFNAATRRSPAASMLGASATGLLATYWLLQLAEALLRPLGIALVGLAVFAPSVVRWLLLEVLPQSLAGLFRGTTQAAKNFSADAGRALPTEQSSESALAPYVLVSEMLPLAGTSRSFPETAMPIVPWTSAVPYVIALQRAPLERVSSSSTVTSCESPAATRDGASSECDPSTLVRGETPGGREGGDLFEDSATSTKCASVLSTRSPCTMESSETSEERGGTRMSKSAISLRELDCAAKIDEKRIGPIVTAANTVATTSPCSEDSAITISNFCISSPNISLLLLDATVKPPPPKSAPDHILFSEVSVSRRDFSIPGFVCDKGQTCSHRVGPSMAQFQKPFQRKGLNPSPATVARFFSQGVAQMPCAAPPEASDDCISEIDTCWTDTDSDAQTEFPPSTDDEREMRFSSRKLLASTRTSYLQRPLSVQDPSSMESANGM